MLKETENEEIRYFCQMFIISGISIEEARASWATPPGYAYNFEITSHPSVLSYKKHLKQN